MASESHKPFLPLEIVVNILKRLPIKSIVRFQCVCRDWKNLFKTQSFIAEHSRHSAHGNPFLLVHEYNGPSSVCLLNHEMETDEVLSIPSIDSFREGWRIIASCNGLLCVLVNSDQGRSPSSLLLWNPLIRQVRKIPLKTNDYWGFCAYGFGFSSVVNDFKIVRFYNQEVRKNRKDQRHNRTWYDGVEVFSLSTGSWKELEFEFGALRKRRFMCEAVNVDGTISWLGAGRFSPTVVSFDIANEVFTLTPMAIEPRIPTEQCLLCGLGVYDNRLVVHSVIEDDSESHFISVWVLEEVFAGESGKSFLSATKKFRFGPSSKVIDPGCVWRNEIVCLDRSDRSEVESDPKCVLHLINLSTGNEVRKFNCANAYFCCNVFSYEKSLVSVWN